MRLSQYEIQSIKEVVYSLDRKARIYLFDTINILDNAVHWRQRSYTICSGIGVKESYTEEEYDHLETLTSRFARVGDIIIQKVFRVVFQTKSNS